MKLLVYGINFHPEPTGIGKFSGEMTARLAAMGHEVRVVTAPPYYPSWRIFDGWRNAYASSEWKGVRIWRAPLWVPAVPNGLKRVVHLLSFALAAVPLMLRQWLWRPDVVLVVAPAMACAPVAWLTARACGARAWLHVQDFEVDAAFQLGLLNSNGLRRRWVNAVESWLLRRFDRVSTISHRMLQRAMEKGVPRDALVYLPNWVDEGQVRPIDRVSRYREQLGIPDGAVVALFSGTLGGKQGLELLPSMARLLQEQRRNGQAEVVLVICGDGVMKPLLEAQVQGLPNVRMLPLQPAEQVNEWLNLADIHLLPQHPGAADVVMPSKLSAMLATGRPVVTTTHPGTELERVVQQCGRVVLPDNPQALASAVRKLADDPALCRQLGLAARRYAEDHLAKTAVLSRLESCLLACLQQERSGLELPVELS